MKKSSGLFIFASTLVRLIESEHHEPNERPQFIVTAPDSTVHAGCAGVNPLLHSGFSACLLQRQGDTVSVNLRRVLAAVVLAFNPLSRRQIGGILDLSLQQLCNISTWSFSSFTSADPGGTCRALFTSTWMATRR